MRPTNPSRLAAAVLAAVACISLPACRQEDPRDDWRESDGPRYQEDAAPDAAPAEPASDFGNA